MDVKTNDVLEGNLPIYHIDRTIKENGKIFDDRAHIVYVNEEKIEVAKRMLDDGELSIDKIAKYLALPIEIVEKLADSLQLV